MSIIIIKAVIVFFDIGILFLVYLLSNKNFKKTIFYAINPVTILITTLHGQFDVIPVFFILLSIYFLQKKRELWSILSFSFAFLLKTWPVIFFIPLLKKIRNKQLGLLIVSFPVIFVIIYIYFFKSSLIDIGKTLINYQGLWGIWGPWSWIGQTRIFMQKTTTIFFLISFFGYSWFNKTKNIIKNIYRLLIFFFVFSTNFSIQYFAWLIPFLVLVKPKRSFGIIILITVYLFSFYYVWIFCINCKIIPDWVIISQNIIGFMLWFKILMSGIL